MLYIKCKNIPSGANSWYVKIWEWDSSEHSYVPIYEPENSMPATGIFGTSSIISSSNNLITFICYSNQPGTGYNIIASKDITNFNLVNGKTYEFDWASEEIIENDNNSDTGNKNIIYVTGAAVLLSLLFLWKR
jgi:hypothetical protein